MRVLLEGTYGIGNFGDDLLARIAHEYLVQAGHQVVLAGRADSVASPGMPEITVGRLDLKAKLRAIRWADVVVIGGGGQFNDNSSRTGGAHLVLTLILAELLSRPVFVTATGFGPLRKRLARGVWRWLGRSRNAQFAFREAIGERTYRGLTGRDSSLVWDLALSGFGREMIIDLVGVPHPHGAALLNFRTFRRNRSVERVIVETMLAEGYRIEGVMADSKDDIGREEFMHHGIDQCRTYGGIPDFLTAIAGSEAVVTQRFHVLVACALLGVPVVPLVYAEKMLDFCECFGLPYVTVSDNDPVKIKNAVHAALTAHPIQLSLLSDRTDPLEWLQAALWRT